MRLRLEQHWEELGEGTALLAEKRGHVLVQEEEAGTEEVLSILPVQEEILVLHVKKKGSRAVIRFGQKVQFFRGLGMLLAHWKEGEWEHKEKTILEENGAMFDCSRNGVLRPEKIQEYLELMAMLGMNQMMLYTEDTYEVPGFPSFGALRGRYTKEEIRQCDAYARMLGIELVPCIQTLAHLHTALRWPAMEGLRDNIDILLAGKEETYALIDAMLASVSAMFSSRKVHLGMDEAFYLGLGNYLRLNGFRDRIQIMKEHLDRVLAICHKYGLEPMIWSDMYFSLASPTGEYYNVEEDYEWKPQDRPKKEVGLVYWDYYHHDTSTYESMIRLHKRLTDQVIFAGGGWTWNGLAPNYSKALDTTKKAFRALENCGVKRAFCTLWQDNGAETPMDTGILPLVYFAECAAGGPVETEALKRRWEELFPGSSLDTMLLLDELDRVPGVKEHNQDGANPSKYLFYQDPLLGMFDGQIQGLGLGKWYQDLAQKIGCQAKKEERFRGLYSYYELLARFLGKKSELGLQIRKAYVEDCKEELEEICQITIPQCIREVQALKDRREKLWFQDCKAQGYEVLDIRFSGVRARLESTQKRLEAYLEGQVKKLEELEEDRILWLPDKEGRRQIPSCNLWEFIASPNNLKGV